MTELLEKSIQTLELPRVLAMLADEAVTEEGKETCRKVRPQTVVSDVSRLQKQTSAAFQMLVKHGTPSFSGVRPVAAALQRADREQQMTNKCQDVVPDGTGQQIHRLLIPVLIQ